MYVVPARLCKGLHPESLYIVRQALFDQPEPKPRSIDAIRIQEGHCARFLFGIKLVRARAKLQIRSYTFSVSRENILASWSCSPQIDEVCDEVCDAVQCE